MSAFIVNKNHINALIQAGLNHGKKYGSAGLNYRYNGEWKKLDYDNANETGQMLLNTNIASVEYRYPDSELTDLPGRVDCDYIIPFEYHFDGHPFAAVQVIKLINCYEYQACELDNWEKTEACAYCQALKENYISEIPGYDEAQWEWRQEPSFGQRLTRLV